jgi:VWFA-related protein
MVLLLWPLFCVLAQSNPPGPAQAPAGEAVAPTFRAETNLVLVRFQFAAKKGSPATDLGPEEIELREDGIRQKIAVFQGGQLHPQSVPVEVNLLFADLRPPSGAVGPSWMRSQAFDLSAIDDHERVSIAIWAIGKNLVRLASPTRDANRLRQAMDGLWQVWANTGRTERAPLFGAVATLAHEAAQGRTNVVRMLVVVTNDVDSFHDKNGVAEAVRAARDAGIPIFPVLDRSAVGTSQASVNYDDKLKSSGLTATDFEKMNNSGVGAPPGYPPLVDEFLALAKTTNGRSLTVDYLSSGNTFNQVFKWLGEQIRGDYVAGFYPASPSGRKPHKIQVMLKDSKRGQIAGDVQSFVY